MESMIINAENLLYRFFIFVDEFGKNELLDEK